MDLARVRAVDQVQVREPAAAQVQELEPVPVRAQEQDPALAQDPVHKAVLVFASRARLGEFMMSSLCLKIQFDFFWA